MSVHSFIRKLGLRGTDMGVILSDGVREYACFGF